MTPSRGVRSSGPLHGVPQAIKDLALTRGLLTTFGSHLFADFVPDEDAIIVERMRAAGALIIGKTNVPEYGYGSNSYNPLFGLTRNAYDPSKVGGGSSCGAGVREATRRSILSKSTAKMHQSSGTSMIFTDCTISII